MIFQIKKLLITLSLTTFSFLFLIIIIQNSFVKKKVTFLNYETINFPVSFIIGSSFISGSLIGSFFSFNSNRNIK